MTTTNVKKAYIVYDGDGMEGFTTMKGAIAYATGGQDVYTSASPLYVKDAYNRGRISMASIRRDLKDWLEVSGYTLNGNRFTITPIVLHKKGSVV
tara:strand:+ start:23 stop:307 length:285 start_codon:yes stop_codon:yes gene_type:complete